MRLWTIVLEISVLMAQFPSREIAQLSYEYRTLGLGYANLGGLLMSSGIPYDSDAGRADCRRAHRDPDRRELCHLGGDGGGAWRRSPGSRRTASTCCASSATTAARRTASAPAMRGLQRRRFRSITRPVRTRRMIEHAERAWDRALSLGEQHGYRNAQASVIAPDRHHRPGHGLRHHRHRARLRAGEVQEARRRRLFQDHQPRGAGSAAGARLFASRRSPRSRPMRSAMAASTMRPASISPR